MKFSSTSNIVHELDPKKNGYFAPVDKQNIIQIFSNLRVSILWKSMMSYPNQQLLEKNGGILLTRMDQSNEFENEFKVEQKNKTKKMGSFVQFSSSLTRMDQSNEFENEFKVEQKNTTKKMGSFVQFSCSFPEL